MAIKFDGWAPNRHCKNIGGFKLHVGGLVRDRHKYICKYAELNLVVAKIGCQTAKFNSPPKFPAIL